MLLNVVRSAPVPQVRPRQKSVRSGQSVNSGRARGARGEARVPTHYFENIEDFAERHGSSARAIYARAKLDRARVLRDGTVRFTELRALLLATAKETGREAFALELGSSLTPASHGALGLGALASENVRDALSVITAYVRTRTPLVRVTHHTREGTVTLRIADGIVLGDVQRPIHELVMCTLMSALRLLTQGRFEASAVRFAFPAPPYEALAARLLGVKPRYDARATELSFDASLSDLAIVLADRTAARLARAQLDAEIAALEARMDLRDRVREHLLRDRGEMPSCAVVARRLGTTERSLRRHLEAAGTSFQAIAQTTRKELALHYLRDTSLSIAEIARRLGYADPSNFGAAFRRWTGKSPRAVR